MTKKPNNTEENIPQKKTTAGKVAPSKKLEEPAPEPRHHGANQLSSGIKHSMKMRIISAIVMVIVIIPAIFLGDWIYFALMTFALGVACWEILGCANKRLPAIFIAYFFFVALITYWPIFKTMLSDGLQATRIDTYFTSIYLSIIVIVIGFFLLFGLTVIYKDFSVVDACFLIAMGILIGFGFQCLFFLRYYPASLINEKQTMYFTYDNTVKSSLLILFVILSTISTDIGAYFVGVFFGKNKMNERISPKKTWEGFVGGIIVSFLITAGVALTFAGFKHPIIPLLDLEHWYFILILAILIPLFATLGDFVFSSIKRYWGIKDYGKLIPGHGGVLDRLDSIFFASIISAIFVFMLASITAGELDWAKLLV